MECKEFQEVKVGSSFLLDELISSIFHCIYLDDSQPTLIHAVNEYPQIMVKMSRAGFRACMLCTHRYMRASMERACWNRSGSGRILSNLSILQSTNERTSVGEHGDTHDSCSLFVLAVPSSVGLCSETITHSNLPLLPWLQLSQLHRYVHSSAKGGMYT